jgi:hypothetical protein
MTAYCTRPYSRLDSHLAAPTEPAPLKGLKCLPRRSSPLADQPPLLLSESRVEVQYEGIGIRAELGDNKRDPLGHETRHKGYVARERPALALSPMLRMVPLVTLILPTRA